MSTTGPSSASTPPAFQPRRRRSMAEWMLIMEEAALRGQTQEMVARALECSEGTVASAFARAQRVRPQGAVRHAGPLRRGRARKAVPEGLRMANSAAIAAVAAEVSADRRVLNAEREGRASAIRAGLLEIAHCQVEDHRLAAQLVRTIVQQALARCGEPPPPMPDVTTPAGDVERMLEVRSAWDRETRAAMKQALDAARVLNASPIMGSAGFGRSAPQPEEQEGTGDLAEMLTWARGGTSAGWTPAVTGEAK